MKKWKTLESKTLFKNQWFDVKEERVQVSEDLAIEGVLVHYFTDWVNMIPITKEGDLLLVSQYRHGMQVMTIETPSGSVEPTDASPEEAATRELFEETGYAVGKVIFLGKSQANPQLMNNHVHHFLALDCHLVAQPTVEIGGIDSFWREPLESALQKIRSGELNHSITVEGLYRADDWLRRNKNSKT